MHEKKISIQSHGLDFKKVNILEISPFLERLKGKNMVLGITKVIEIECCRFQEAVFNG